MDAEVDVIMRAIPDYKFEQIGIVTLTAGTIQEQVEKVKIIARQNGGNVAVLAEVKQGVTTTPNMATGGTMVSVYDIRTFEIGRKVQNK